VVVAFPYPVPELLVNSLTIELVLLPVVSNELLVYTTVCGLDLDLEGTVSGCVACTSGDALHVGLYNEVSVVTNRDCLTADVFTCGGVPDAQTESGLLDVKNRAALHSSIPLVPDTLPAGKGVW